VNPNTAAQTDVRAGFSQWSQAWKGLGQAARDAWIAYAAAHPRLDALGQSIVLTGLQYYVGVQTLLQLVGAGANPYPPGYSSVLNAPVISVDEDSIAGPPAIAFTPTPIPANQAMIVYSSPPRTKGVSFNRDFRYLLAAPAAEASPLDIGTELTTKWGTLLPGQRFFLRAKAIWTGTSDAGLVSTESNIITLDLVA